MALGVQFGTALSPLLNGWIAAASLPRAYLLNGVLAGSALACWCSPRAISSSAAELPGAKYCLIFSTLV